MSSGSLEKVVKCMNIVLLAALPIPTTTANVDPGSKDAIWSYAISIVSPMLVWALIKLVPKLPKPVLPVITPVVGIGLGVGLHFLAGAQIGWIDMAKAGALAVFVRETVNQLVTKQLAKVQITIVSTGTVTSSGTN